MTAESRDEETLSLQVPSDGEVRSLRALLDRLDAQSIDVSGLSVETPDLDDVFLSLTGTPGSAPAGGDRQMSAQLVRADRLGDDAQEKPSAACAATPP